MKKIKNKFIYAFLFLNPILNIKTDNLYKFDLSKLENDGQQYLDKTNQYDPDDFLFNNQSKKISAKILPQTKNETDEDCCIISQKNHYIKKCEPDSIYSLNFYANLYTDYFNGKSLELFSDSDFDKYSFFQQSIDLGFNLDTNYLQKHNFKLFTEIRAKGIFGDQGKFIKFEQTPTKVGIGRTESKYGANVKNELLWIRNLKFTYNYDHCNKPKSFSIGLFPYNIGFGLSLGNAHLIGKTIPGLLYDERFIDQFRPGILFTQKIEPKKFSFDIYYGIIKNKNSNLIENAEFIRAQEIFNRTSPWRDSDVVNSIFVTKCDLDINLNKCDDNALLRVTPYIIFNSDQEQKVEFLGDAIGSLATFGLYTKYKDEKFSGAIEFAFNLGNQFVKSIDRNFFFMDAKPWQTHLFEKNEEAWVVSTHQTFPEDLAFSQNAGAEFYDEFCKKRLLKNSFNRFRNAYNNYFHGWMAIADFAWKTNFDCDRKIKFALLAGIASGDEQPNDSNEKILANRLFNKKNFYKDHDKNYDGFIGIESMYTGKNVKSVFLLEARKLNRPVSTTYDSFTYPEFTNLGFFGAGLKFKKKSCYFKYSIHGNIVAYLQQSETRKDYNYTLDTLFQLNVCNTDKPDEILTCLQKDACKKLSHGLGIEFNIFADLKVGKNFKLYAVAAALVPLGYYDDAKCKEIPLEMQFRLARPDFTGFESNEEKYNIRLGNKTAFLFNLGFEYNFDWKFC